MMNVIPREMLGLLAAVILTVSACSPGYVEACIPTDHARLRHW